MNPTSPTLVRERVRHDFAVRPMTVTRWRDVTPRLRRVTLAGPMDGFASLGPADHVKVFFPNPVTGELHAPRVAPGGGIERPQGVELVSRDYTPLVNDDDELELDFFLHGDGGPAAGWAARVTEGDRIVVAGPRGSKLAPTGVDRFVLGGDESALPALSRWLRILPDDADVTVLAEVQDADDEAYLAGLAGPGCRITWLHRGDDVPGTTSLIEDAVRALPSTDGLAFWWFGGEAGTLQPVRRYLRRELGLDASTVECSGYWRRGVANHDHHVPVDPDDAE
ncbi:siderophore-interacting protein [Georgenia sp. EYE_87]|uniref:siderophore-interacting protein n=1 Tax=Georgenia sp. EYE_87 TaxID=2853448 RepID=UPI002002BB3A|nr:siderophore-interacting protein [Georgenia sp. EYE_87]MCK6210116.1 siderophore-interacting protein [Georgenia sp. EYE_87]